VFVKPDSLESESFTAFAAISAHTTTIEGRSRPHLQSSKRPLVPANRHGLPARRPSTHSGRPKRPPIINCSRKALNTGDRLKVQPEGIFTA
jgi:hypothetical protein